MVSALGYGTTGLTLRQRVFGLTDWTRDGTLAEYVAVEARNLAPLPGDVDFAVGASLPISGLTAWQGLFEHGHLHVGQSVLVHGAPSTRPSEPRERRSSAFVRKDTGTATHPALLVDQRQPSGPVGRLVPKDVIGLIRYLGGHPA